MHMHNLNCLSFYRSNSNRLAEIFDPAFHSNFAPRTRANASSNITVAIRAKLPSLLRRCNFSNCLAIIFISLISIKNSAAQVGYCTNQAGTIDTMLQVVCAKDTLKVTTQNPIMQPGSILTYVLQDSSQTIIYDHNVNGIFVNAGNYPTNVQHYLFAVVGENDNSGLPNLTAECTKISNKIPIVLLNPILIKHTTICDRPTGTANVNFTITGVSSALFNDKYFATGSYVGSVSLGEQYSIGPFDDGESYCINIIIDEIGCSESICSKPISISHSNNCDTFTSTGVFATQANKPYFEIVNIFPVPVLNNFEMILNSQIYQTINIKIYNSMGKLMKTKTCELNHSVSKISFDIKSFSSGVYMVSAVSGERVVSKKFIKT